MYGSNYQLYSRDRLRLLGLQYTQIVRAAMTIGVVLILNTTQSFADSENNYGLPTAKPEQLGLSTERLGRIQAMAQRYIDAGKIPGLIAVVARQGKVVHFSAQGYANVEDKKPLQLDTIFRMYSQSKIVNAVAVMMLYEQGSFLLDDPIANYLPEFAEVQVYGEEGLLDPKRPLTIRHLLTHTSGISTPYDDHPVGKLYKKHGIDHQWSTVTSGITLQEHIKQQATLPLRSHPGDEFYYAYNMTILARLVEVRSGQRYSAFLQQHIFDPLGMVDTGFYVPASKIHRLAQLYQWDEQRGLVNVTADWQWDTPPSLEMGDSGLVSTAHDYVRFTQMLLNGGRLDGVRYLSPTTVKLIRSNHLPSHITDQPYPGAGSGLTVAVNLNPALLGYGNLSKGSYNWGGAADTRFVIDPANDLFFLTFNQLLKSPHLMGYRTGALVYQALLDE